MANVIYVDVSWATPAEISAAGTAKWDRIHIYRSTSENGGYDFVLDSAGSTISDIASNSNSVWTETWQDTTVPVDRASAYYYIVRYYDSTAKLESKFYLTVKSLTPKEQRLVGHIKNMLTPWIGTGLGDDDMRAGLIFGMNAINIFPPVTSFSLATFPQNMEPLLITGSGAFTLMYKYLGVAFTDLSYNDNGLSLSVDRGAKVQAAVDKLMKYYNELLTIAKMEYAYGGSGVGTMQLPVSLGGNMSRSCLNVLDVLNAVGRIFVLGILGNSALQYVLHHGIYIASKVIGC